MARTRRGLGTVLAAGAASLSLSATVNPAFPATTPDTLKTRVLASFDGLPGQVAIKIWAPATGRHPEFLVAQNAGAHMFIGSSIKAFVLCERMRQLDSPDIVDKLTRNQLTLDESIWSADSATFNPPHLTGQVSERTAMEAMILHSDNTAADMMLRQTGPEKVRAFLTSAGLGQSAVPDSTRAFFGYLIGAKDPRDFTWPQLQSASAAPIVKSPLNETQTLASSADDLVSFYSRSVAGEFFAHAETLQQYRNILTLGDVIGFLVPLGVSAFAKGGSIDVEGFHALCAPGAMFFAGRWVYFALILNWTARAESDPATVTSALKAMRQALNLVVEGLSPPA